MAVRSSISRPKNERNALNPIPSQPWTHPNGSYGVCMGQGHLTTLGTAHPLLPRCRLASAHRHDPFCELVGRFGHPLDRPPGRWGGQAAQNRQPGHQCSCGSLLQCREAGFRTGLAVGLHGSVSVPQIDRQRRYRCVNCLCHMSSPRRWGSNIS